MDKGSSDILAQLNNAMTYIEEHIDDDLALCEVSSVTKYSSFHFGRLFYYIADMPLSEYIRKRKLSLAASDLQSSNEKIIDIANKYGYDSADSFTRAFIKQHGVTPSAARKDKPMLKIFPSMTFQIKIQGVQSMNCRIEKKEAFTVLGVQRRFKNDNTDEIPAFCSEIHNDGTLDKLKSQTERDDYIVIRGHMNEQKGDFLYMIGVFTGEDADSSGFYTIKAPAATWAIFRSEEFDEKQPGTEIPKLLQSAYTEWLPSSGYEKAEGIDGEIYDMEMYGVSESGKYYEEIWLSVTKQ